MSIKKNVKRRLSIIALMLVCIFTITSGQARATLPAPGPGGVECSVDQFTFYGLNNNIHPGEIGLVSVLGCNSSATLIGHQWLLNANGNGGWNSINETYAQKQATNPVAISMTSWYECGSIASSATNLIQSKASWDINFNNGYNTYGDYETNHWTKCYFPSIVSFN